MHTRADVHTQTKTQYIQVHTQPRLSTRLPPHIVQSLLQGAVRSFKENRYRSITDQRPVHDEYAHPTECERQVNSEPVAETVAETVDKRDSGRQYDHGLVCC